MATEKEVNDKWGATHTIEKRMGTDVDLRDLAKGESVVFGDGATYHWLLTEKPASLIDILDEIEQQREDYNEQSKIWTEFIADLNVWDKGRGLIAFHNMIRNKYSITKK